MFRSAFVCRFFFFLYVSVVDSMLVDWCSVMNLDPVGLRMFPNTLIDARKKIDF